jgi:predicted small integral membrane protein
MFLQRQEQMCNAGKTLDAAKWFAGFRKNFFLWSYSWCGLLSAFRARLSLMGSLAEANATKMPVGSKAGACGWAVNN